MPWGLKRYHQTRQLHFVTFSCYHRKPLLADPQVRDTFVRTLETVRRWYGFWLIGYVVMPDHVHLLLSEPERKNLALVLQMLKQMVSRNLPPQVGGQSYREAKGGDIPPQVSGDLQPQPFWQARYYDFNVWSEQKRVEKLRYIHRNPVKRGLVERPEDWLWSSFHHYLTGEEGVVEIESHWTASRREKQGIHPTVRRRDPA
jgi:putative transposase